MSERQIIYKVCKEVEQNFDCICYAYKDKNWWMICISNYDIYCSDSFKVFSKKQRELNTFKVIFCYCNPLESRLMKLNDEENLIMVI